MFQKNKLTLKAWGIATILLLTPFVNGLFIVFMFVGDFTNKQLMFVIKFIGIPIIILYTIILFRYADTIDVSYGWLR